MDSQRPVDFACGTYQMQLLTRMHSEDVKEKTCTSELPKEHSLPISSGTVARLVYAPGLQERPV